MNALVKAPGEMRDKIAFIMVRPCKMCTKLIVQTDVARDAYRKPEGLQVLEQAGVITVHYTRWKDEWL
jgi:deoxycytidylate deaminase